MGGGIGAVRAQRPPPFWRFSVFCVVHRVVLEGVEIRPLRRALAVCCCRVDRRRPLTFLARVWWRCSARGRHRRSSPELGGSAREQIDSLLAGGPAMTKDSLLPEVQIALRLRMAARLTMASVPVSQSCFSSRHILKRCNARASSTTTPLPLPHPSRIFYGSIDLHQSSSSCVIYSSFATINTQQHLSRSYPVTELRSTRPTRPTSTHPHPA